MRCVMVMYLVIKCVVIRCVVMGSAVSRCDQVCGD